MSERYGKCKHCLGYGAFLLEGTEVECGTCGGTGFSGDATLYYASELEKDQTQSPKHIMIIRSENEI